MSFKKILLWLIVLLISLSLISTSFISDSSKKEKNKNKNEKIILKKKINEFDIKNIIESFKNEEKYLKKIKEIEKKLYILVENNIQNNLKYNKKVIITNEELLENIIEKLNPYDKYSNLTKQFYDNFLIKNKIDNYSFQKVILNEINIKKFKNSLNEINKNYFKKLKVTLLNIKYNSKNKKCSSLNKNILKYTNFLTFINISNNNIDKNFYSNINKKKKSIEKIKIKINIIFYKNDYEIIEKKYFNSFDINVKNESFFNKEIISFIIKNKLLNKNLIIKDLINKEFKVNFINKNLTFRKYILKNNNIHKVNKIRKNSNFISKYKNFEKKNIVRKNYIIVNENHKKFDKFKIKGLENKKKKLLKLIKKSHKNTFKINEKI